mmetsp:Transcript_15023/g.26614  ORF Transcript_15023/g.26614 Transcript_15023/m.26614 type:complete len:201 (-) Transcript_15023:408-1010(-)
MRGGPRSFMTPNPFIKSGPPDECMSTSAFAATIRVRVATLPTESAAAAAAVSGVDETIATLLPESTEQCTTVFPITHTASSAAAGKMPLHLLLDGTWRWQHVHAVGESRKSMKLAPAVSGLGQRNSPTCSNVSRSIATAASWVPSSGTRLYSIVWPPQPITASRLQSGEKAIEVTRSQGTSSWKPSTHCRKSELQTETPS